MWSLHVGKDQPVSLGDHFKSFCQIHFDHFNIFLSDIFWPFQYLFVRYILTNSIFCCQLHFDHFNILLSDTFWPFQYLLLDTVWHFHYFVVRYSLTFSILSKTFWPFQYFSFVLDTFRPLQNLAPFLSYLHPEGLINPFDHGHLTFCCYSPFFA